MGRSNPPRSIRKTTPTHAYPTPASSYSSCWSNSHPRPANLKSTADFVDLHAYLGWGLDFNHYMERFGVDGPAEKPTILGEFGVNRRGYLTEAMAAQGPVDLQSETCQYGFDGWLLWTWDTEEKT